MINNIKYLFSFILGIIITLLSIYWIKNWPPSTTKELISQHQENVTYTIGWNIDEKRLRVYSKSADGVAITFASKNQYLICLKQMDQIALIGLDIKRIEK